MGEGWDAEFGLCPAFDGLGQHSESEQVGKIAEKIVEKVLDIAFVKVPENCAVDLHVLLNQIQVQTNGPVKEGLAC